MAGKFKINWKGDKFLADTRNETLNSVKKACIYLQGRAKSKVAKGGGRPHRPSLPFKPPHRDTGVLMASITYAVGYTATGGVYGKVGSDTAVLVKNAKNTTDVDYAAYLEFGTKKMLPRPWLRPAFAESKRRINQIIRDGIKKTLKRYV